TTSGKDIATANGNITLGSGNITTTGTFNTNTFTDHSLQFGGSSAATIYSANGQDLTLDTGNTTGTLGVGTTNANAVSIGRSGHTTTVNGALTAAELLTASSGLTVSTGSTLENASSTLNTALALSNIASNGNITTAANITTHTTFDLTQTTNGITLTIPA